MSDQTDIGSGHSLTWYTAYADPHKRVGVIVWHPVTDRCLQACRDLGQCGGAVPFALDGEAHGDPDRPKWQVLSLDPLTLSPSLLCHCGDHGFIRDGRWVTA